MGGGEGRVADGILKAYDRSGPYAVAELTLNKDQRRTGVFQCVVERLVRDNIAIERNIRRSSLEDGHDTDDHQNGTLDEKTDARLGCNSSSAETAGKATRLAVKFSVCDLVPEVLHSDGVWVDSSIVLESVVYAFERLLDCLAEAELDE